MALDPAAAGLLKQMEEAGMPPLNEMAPADARVAAEGFIPLGGDGDDVGDISNRSVPGPHGDIPIRVYKPKGAAGALPCLVYFHGGGWVIGTPDTTEAICKAVAARANCIVVSVDYRLSPEHKFPVPLDDCFAATEWVAVNGAEIGVDKTRVAVGGDSAGGNLAAAVCLRARGNSFPNLRLQLLVYPVTDHSYATKSYADNGEGHLLTTDMMTWFWDHYLSTPEDGKNPFASPLRAATHDRLPPALVITAEYDPLRDEGEAYAHKLLDAGVPVTLTRYDGMIHAFWQMLAVFPQASRAADQAAGALRAAFA
ncbi:MAG: alpha/beta hydrolase [Acidimicrobiia bacterium]|nr:alpha/beta hydrolase [Acidimicrobiia bacterium]